MEQQVKLRLGLVPNLYRGARGMPEPTQSLWAFAQTAYLDNPLPPLFKERLFVFLSRFSPSRYCLVRHVGFLMGNGRVAGDRAAKPQSVRDVIALLRSPPPGPVELHAAQKEFLALASPLGEMPDSGTKTETAVFQLTAALLLDLADIRQTKAALQRGLGDDLVESLLGLVGYIQSEHLWAKLHPDLTLDDDLLTMLGEYGNLEALLAVDEQFGRSHINQDLYNELQSLRRDKQHRSELLHAKKQLEERDRQKDKFLAVLGHELRNPVAAITAVSEMFQMVNTADNRLRNAGNILHRQTQALGRMLDDLLDVSTFAFGKVFITKSPLSIDELLTDVLHSFEPQLKAAGLTLNKRLASGEAFVLADRTRLSQVFENIFSNALQFTKAPGTVSVSSRIERKEVVVTVTDSGTGFDPAFADAMLQPFSQAPQDLARKQGGLGLGLAIAKMITDLHDGTLTATSAGVGKGATLTLTLPLSTRNHGETVIKASAPSSRIRVLVVEDNRDFAQLFRDMLQIMGCDPEVGATAQLGLEIAKKSVPDMIFCDIGLPGEMDGFGFARAVRADEKLAHIPLIAVSGYTSPEDQQRAIEAGFDRMCPKPVKFGDISESLKRFTEKNSPSR